MVGLACQREQHERNEAPLPSESSAAPGLAAPLELPPARERALRVGELGQAAHYTLSVLETKECVVEAHFKPSAGSVKLGVKVSLEARTALQVPANPFYATLIDASNIVYESTLAGCQPALQATQLDHGQKAAGWVSFDVPAQARGLRFAYAPVLLGPGREELVFLLDR
jgi:hypothetical protein